LDIGDGKFLESLIDDNLGGQLFELFAEAVSQLPRGYPGIELGDLGYLHQLEELIQAHSALQVLAGFPGGRSQVERVILSLQAYPPS
jgi:hypothetical protein